MEMQATRLRDASAWQARLPLQKTKAPRRIFCSHGPVAVSRLKPAPKVNRPQVRTPDGFVPRRTGGYNTPKTKRPAKAGRFELN